MNGQSYNRDTESHKRRYDIYLKPGEVWFGNEPTLVTTVLGSCVSVTFYHATSSYAGICHALQPQCPHPYRCGSGCKEIFRYATCAVEVITEQITAKGARPNEIDVKLFGGSSLISNNHANTKTKTVGKQNIEAAMKAIEKHSLNLRVINVGGNFGRKIKFNSADGVVLMKRLKGALYSDIKP